VLGHMPDFSLGSVDADLLIAGHTHGGQVQLPLVGPLLTLSQVPRSWASGLTEIEPGKMLVVSRGIGMERGLAPRLRFLCRPQLVILELVPSGQGGGREGQRAIPDDLGVSPRWGRCLRGVAGPSSGLVAEPRAPAKPGSSSQPCWSGPPAAPEYAESPP
jgi:hypothetical protein